MRLSLKSLFFITSVFISSAALAADEPKVDCGKSKLTGAQFMEMFHTIAMHGDLRDIPFIEKTLGIKFTHEHPLVAEDKRNIHQINYMAGIYGTPIGVTMKISDDNDDQNLSDNIAVIVFTYSNDFSKCLHITRKQFESYFGGEFVHLPSADAGNGSSDKLLKKTEGKAQIDVGYILSDDGSDERINAPSIGQLKPTSEIH
jgi:hypothetical protein